MRLYWEYTIEEALFHKRLDMNHAGKRADSGWKSEAWGEALNAVLPELGKLIYAILVRMKICHLYYVAYMHTRKWSVHFKYSMVPGIEMGAPFYIMVSGTKWTLHSKRNKGRFQMDAPFRNCNGSSITKKNQALKLGQYKPVV